MKEDMEEIADAYETWLERVRGALREINMEMREWQAFWQFDFRREFDAGVNAADAAMKANRFWWRQQRMHDIGLLWLAPVERSAPTYAPGDYVKVEFADEAAGIGEWMWIRVTGCDEQRQLVFGPLDSEPLNDCGGKVAQGSELAASFFRVRKHKYSSLARCYESQYWNNGEEKEYVLSTLQSAREVYADLSK